MEWSRLSPTLICAGTNNLGILQLQRNGINDIIAMQRNNDPIFGSYVRFAAGEVCTGTTVVQYER
jgi:hypothetical protein